jgi:hypothetical protein
MRVTDSHRRNEAPAPDHPLSMGPGPKRGDGVMTKVRNVLLAMVAVSAMSVGTVSSASADCGIIGCVLNEVIPGSGDLADGWSREWAQGCRMRRLGRRRVRVPRPAISSKPRWATSAGTGIWYRILDLGSRSAASARQMGRAASSRASSRNHEQVKAPRQLAGGPSSEDIAVKNFQKMICAFVAFCRNLWTRAGSTHWLRVPGFGGQH